MRVSIGCGGLSCVFIGANLFLLLSADGARGPPNEAVDVQKNRIIATAALKKAEPLADEGRCCLLVAVVGAKVMR